MRKIPMNYSRLPWKKSFQKLPPLVEASLAKFSNQDFVVACSKVITTKELEAGIYRHLYLETLEDIPTAMEWLIPSPNVGPASFYNATPVEKPNKNLPKVRKRFRGRAPNGKNWGFHATTFERDVWHQQLIVPSMRRISFQRIPDATPSKSAMVRFQVQEVFNRSDPDCLKHLLRCLNLLQENVGKAELFPANAAEAEFIRRTSEEIGWEIIPDSKRDEALGTLARKLGKRRPELVQKAQNRFDLILSLEPKRILQSTRGFVGYFAVEFTPNLTIFENLELDHAMYVIRQGSHEFSKLTRTELREKLGTTVERVIHSKGWEARLTRIVKAARGEQLDPLI